MRTHSRFASQRSVVLLCSAALCLSACSGADTPPTDSRSLETSGPGYAADFEDLRQRAKGTKDEEVTLKIYEDNAISDAELVEAGGRYSMCIRDAGFPGYSIDPFGFSFGITNPTPEEEKRFLEADERCSESTGFMWVRSMWASLRQNPSNINWSELHTACLVKLGVVDPAFSGKDLDKVYEDFGRMLNDGQVTDSQEPTDFIPFIVDLQEGKAADYRCHQEPQNVLGFSTANATH